MGFLKTVGAAVSAISRLLGFKQPPISACEVVEPGREMGPGDAKPVFTPAVAGFVQRAYIDQFFFAARLASVAKLNTPLGRKPRIANKRANLPAVPSERLGGKKQRLNGNQGPRVLKPALKVALPQSNVVPFPIGVRAAAIQNEIVAKAA